MKKSLISLALLAATASAQAADPTATSLTSGMSFAEYTGSTPVGRGDVDDNTRLYYIDEADTSTTRAWTIFFDPTATMRVRATLQFDRPIVAVQTSSSAYEAGTSVYGVDVDGDGHMNDYDASGSTGLETNDVLTWSSGATTLTLDWRTNLLGDHIRVITAVPEPSTYLMMIVGFALMGYAGLRRQRRG